MNENHQNRILEWLNKSVALDASDLHLVVGHPPVCRIHGRLELIDDVILDDEFLTEQIKSVCDERDFSHFIEFKNSDFAFQANIAGQLLRFRANLFYANGKIGACFRIIPPVIPDLNWAGFPQDVANRLADYNSGLVIISGVTGAGKSTTLAMIVNMMNQMGEKRIITVEEPIEYLFPKASSTIITQREVGRDVKSFAEGLRFGLRQDPDVILIGEIRDRETAQMALSAAETGHLVFSTLHTHDAKGAVSRFADFFAQSVQHEIRAQLAISLRAVISQHLLPSAMPESKRELALEILYVNSPVAASIRTGKMESIDNLILTNRAEGMLTLDESLKRLLNAGRISRTTAERIAKDKNFLYR
jgi:twitching motility protein PilT